MKLLRPWYSGLVTEPGAMSFTMSSGGIVSYEASDSPVEVWVRVRPGDGGRLEISEVYLTTEVGDIRSDDLRRVPLGRIETFINRPDKQPWLLERLDGPHRSLDAAALQAREKRPSVEDTYKRMAARQRRNKAKVPVPEGRKYPDSFYLKVAAAYLELAADGGRPAAEMAEANDVPMTQVHRWVKEARRRGLLPPGRPGKAG
jgi:hypothetical protein